MNLKTKFKGTVLSRKELLKVFAGEDPSTFSDGNNTGTGTDSVHNICDEIKKRLSSLPPDECMAALSESSLCGITAIVCSSTSSF